MIDNRLHNYFITVRAARHIVNMSAQDLFYARTFGEKWITDIIAEGNGALQRRALDAAREFGYVIPVSLRG